MSVLQSIKEWVDQMNEIDSPASIAPLPDEALPANSTEAVESSAGGNNK